MDDLQHDLKSNLLLVLNYKSASNPETFWYASQVLWVLYKYFFKCMYPVSLNKLLWKRYDFIWIE